METQNLENFTEQLEDEKIESPKSGGLDEEQASNEEHSLTEQESSTHVASREQYDSESEQNDQETDHVTTDNLAFGSPLSNDPFENNEVLFILSLIHF